MLMAGLIFLLCYLIQQHKIDGLLHSLKTAMLQLPKVFAQMNRIKVKIFRGN